MHVEMSLNPTGSAPVPTLWCVCTWLKVCRAVLVGCTPLQGSRLEQAPIYLAEAWTILSHSFTTAIAFHSAACLMRSRSVPGAPDALDSAWRLKPRSVMSLPLLECVSSYHIGQTTQNCDAYRRSWSVL